MYVYMFSGRFLHICKGTKITPPSLPPGVGVNFYMFQFNFVGRLLGPRGNSLKRVEAFTGCRVFIRGKGSIKDPDKVLLFSYNILLQVNSVQP